MDLLKIDWEKAPEIRWEKQLCPFCNEPTGPESQCFKAERRATNNPGEYEDSEYESEGEIGQSYTQTRFTKTVEINGQIVPIFSKQCIFRRYSNYYIDLNFPISRMLAVLISALEGVEQFYVESKYRGLVTIGNQFDDQDIKKKVTETYQKYIHENRETILKLRKFDD